MSRIRSKNTKIETIIFKELRRRGIYFQKHYDKILGKPDIALPSKKIAIFIDGDFWHGWQFSRRKQKLPKKYWQEKIERNIKRDRKNFAKLRRQGWNVLRVWEHQIKNDFQGTINKIINLLKS